MKEYLLPYRFKWIGAGLLIIGIAGLIYFLLFDFILVVPVFAVVSSMLETKVFSVVRTNVADELIMAALLAGFFLMAFSKEKTETEKLDLLRMRAFVKAAWVNSALLLFSILFLYGKGFLVVLMLNLFSMFALYFVFFILEKKRKNS
jgi:hypothetical protein